MKEYLREKDSIKQLVKVMLKWTNKDELYIEQLNYAIKGVVCNR